jgi:outer membrane lipoprotein-sorting protein
MVSSFPCWLRSGGRSMSTRLKIDVTKLSLNEKLEDDQFELKIPPGITIQKME